MLGKRVVDYDTAAQFANQLGVAYFETSAKTGQNIECAFLTLAKEVKSALTDNETTKSSVTVSLAPTENEDDSDVEYFSDDELDSAVVSKGSRSKKKQKTKSSKKRGKKSS